MKFILFIIFIFNISLNAQFKLLHQDPEMFRAVRQGLNHVYNYEFDQAQPYFAEIKKKYPQHPAYPFSQALILFTKNFPMKPGHPDYKIFDHYVKECLIKSEAILEKDPNNSDGIFCALSSHSYQALMFSFSKDYMQAVGAARKVYNYMKQGFNLKKEYPDFYYTSGLFYYYAAQYPETHPMVKPLMWFFENGNKKQGINDLNIALLKGIYTKQEALILLSYITIKYESDPLKSLEYSEKFYFNYPNNPFALSRYIEALIFSRNYNKAIELLPKLQVSKTDYFKMVAEVYSGMIQESHFKNYEFAKKSYSKAINMCTTLQNKTDDFQSFSYIGLGRISDIEKNRKRAIVYYRKSMEMCEYESVRKECKERIHKVNTPN